MRILVTAPGEFAGAELMPGELYEVAPCEDGAGRQNRAFHALVAEYFVSGCHSYDATSLAHFRELIKLNLGAGAERYYSLVGPTGKPVKKPIVRYRVKSWRDYAKKERTDAIDALISEMRQAGVQTRRFYEILQGLEGPHAGGGKLAMEASG